MKTQIDALSMLPPLTGIGRYGYEVSRHLVNHSKEFDITFFYGYNRKKLLHPHEQTNVNRAKRFFSRYGKIKNFARKIVNFSNFTLAKNFDIYWQPNFIPLQSAKAKKIITTIHDLSFLHYKHYHKEENIVYYEKYFHKNLAKVDLVITVSHFIKKEIINNYNLDPQKIKVIYNGIDHHIFNQKAKPHTKLDLPQKFILFVGSIEPRKNLVGLLQAYDLLDQTMKEEYKLVLAGFKGWKNREIMHLIEKNKKNIIYLGYLEDKELAIVYKSASLFVYPSFYEGFGLPVVEAMACATPVICSNTSALPEIAQDAAIYCDPNSSQNIADTIANVLQDEDIQQQMRNKGLLQAQKFSWEKSASQHREAFMEIVHK